MPKLDESIKEFEKSIDRSLSEVEKAIYMRGRIDQMHEEFERIK